MYLTSVLFFSLWIVLRGNLKQLGLRTTVNVVYDNLTGAKVQFVSVLGSKGV